MVMAQTLFKILKLQDPDSLIGVLAPDWSRPILDRMPEVAKTHVMPIGHGKLELKKRRTIAQTLQSEDYTQAIVLPNSWKSALIPWWAKIPKRTGFVGEGRFGLLNDARFLNKKRLPRMIDRFAVLAYSHVNLLPHELPVPQLEVDPGSVKVALEKFNLNTEAQKPILALCPGAEFGASKRWPESYYAKVAKKKLKEGWSVWLFGSKNDQAVASAIQQQSGNGCVDLTGKTNLAEAIDLLSLAKLVVTNDSGLMHIAAALNRPLIAVYGSTDPGFTPPLGPRSDIVRLSLPCSPCFKRQCPLQHHNCMQNLTPEKVLAAMDRAVV